jgi:hypothetical protein
MGMRYIEEVKANVIGGILESLEEDEALKIISNTIESNSNDIEVLHEVSTLVVGWYPLPTLTYTDTYKILDGLNVVLVKSELSHPSINEE